MTVTDLGEARARLVDLERERAELLAMIAKLGQGADELEEVFDLVFDFR